jgi:hypothetical protein
MDYIVFTLIKKMLSTFKTEDSFSDLTFVHLRQFFAIKEVNYIIIQINMREKHVCSTITIEIRGEILRINIITLFARGTNAPH